MWMIIQMNVMSTDTKSKSVLSNFMWRKKTERKKERRHSEKKRRKRNWRKRRRRKEIIVQQKRWQFFKLVAVSTNNTSHAIQWIEITIEKRLINRRKTGRKLIKIAVKLQAKISVWSKRSRSNWKLWPVILTPRIRSRFDLSFSDSKIWSVYLHAQKVGLFLD